MSAGYSSPAITDCDEPHNAHCKDFSRSETGTNAKNPLTSFLKELLFPSSPYFWRHEVHSLFQEVQQRLLALDILV